MSKALLILFITILLGCESDPYLNTCETNRISISPQIKADDSITIFLPTAFTPNGDRLNETFYPVGTGILSYSLVVHLNNKKVFSGSENEAWDGTDLENKRVQGNYTYEINLESKKNKKFVARGVVSLIRDPSIDVCKCRFEDMINPTHGFVQPSFENCL